MKKFEDAAAELIARSLGREPSELAPLVAAPPRPEMGDYSFPCFNLSKSLKKDPKSIAAELARNLPLEGSPFALVQAVGPYLNFRLADEALALIVLEAVRQEGGGFGGSEEGRGRTVVVDYSSPNIAKPFHIGHLRSTVIGASLHRIYSALGYRAMGVNHLGDWGTQFGMVMAAFAEAGDPAALERDPIGYSLQLYVDYNARCEEDPAARDRAKTWFKRLEDNDPEAVRLWQTFRDLSLAKFERIYERLGARFDHYHGESFYNDKMTAALARAQAAGALAAGEDGARMIRLDQFGMPPFILVKSDGATLYATRELAAAFYRFETFQPELLLYVVGTPQELHFRQFKKSLELMGCDWADRIVHVKFGHVLGMSTRRGEVVLLEEVLDEARAKAREKIEDNIRAGKLDPEVDREELADKVGIGALIVNDLKHRRERDIVFDWDQALQFDGETGPYLQYAYARIRGIMSKAGIAEPPEAIAFSALDEPESRALLRALADFPGALERAGREFEPSQITTHLFDLTKALNLFYNRHRVIGSGEPRESARLRLVAATGQVIKNALELLGAPVLERM